jgi:hypothetical protein
VRRRESLHATVSDRLPTLPSALTLMADQAVCYWDRE